MTRVRLSLLHILVAILGFLFATSKLNGEIKPEIIGYVLKPTNDVHCQIEIEIIEAFSWKDIVDVQKEETMEILMDRIVFEETNYWGVNEIFYVDDRPYILVRLPYTGHWWNEKN